MKGKPRRPTRGKPSGQGAREIGRTAIKVFKEKDKQLKRKEKKEKLPMTMTSKNIIKEPEEKGKAEPPPPKGHEHKHHEPEGKKEEQERRQAQEYLRGKLRASDLKPRPGAHQPGTAGYLSPAQAVAKEVRDTELAQGAAEPAPAVKGGVKEAQDDRVLRF